MIEIRDLRLPLERTGGTPEGEAALRRTRALAALGLPANEPAEVLLLHRSIDARGRNVRLVERVAVSLGSAEREEAVLGRAGSKTVRPYEPTMPSWPSPARHAPRHRPVVVGAGVAGLFCALALAHAGLEPVLVEKGPDCERRAAAIRSFFGGGPLDERANVQVGLGGAGAFTDGKLQTGTRDAGHALILAALVEAGAPEEILTDAKPHVGSDVLPAVVSSLARRIEELGGEIRLGTRFTDLLTEGPLENRRLAGVVLENEGREERLSADVLVLAQGHSARDVLELLRERAIALEPKLFAVGVRIEHAQAAVNRALYGRFAESPLLGAAPYRVARKAGNGLRCFSFCMCPGGRVVAAASEAGGVVTNGASLAARDDPNANAALLVNVGGPEEAGDDPLAGVELQRALERAAFERAGGEFRAPGQLVGDFLAGRPSTGAGAVAPSYPRGVAWGDLSELLPRRVTETLRETLPAMARGLPFFSDPEAVLTAPETRSSSPVRIARGADGQSPSVAGLYPVGEGAGWAGGIMSAAADGLRAARAILAAWGERPA